MRSYLSLHRGQLSAVASCLVLLSTLALSQEAEDEGYDESMSEMQELMALLETETEIATRTKLNADYVPGMVNVLYGSKLEEKGARNVWEALAHIPGVELSIEQSGVKQILVRGWGSNIVSGNTKILLNGVSMNNNLFSHPNTLMNMPIEQVKRIEMIRGPGSVNYGEYAYSGVINIITRDRQNSAFVRKMRHNTHTVGAIFATDNLESEFNLSANIAGFRGDGADVQAGPDRLYGMGFGELSLAPGPTNEKEAYESAIIQATYDHSSLTYSYLLVGHGDHFGSNSFLPPPSDSIVIEQTQHTVSLSNSHEWNKNWETRIDLNYAWSEYQGEDLYLAPEGFSPAPGVPPLPNDYFITLYYKESRLSGETSLLWYGLDNHTLMMSLFYSDITVDDAYTESSAFSPDGELIRSRGMANWVDENAKRDIYSAMLQDEIRVTDPLTLTLGLRFDDYSDVGSSLNPRVAAVYRVNENNIIKAQLARAFRPPTFFELWRATGEIDPDKIDTYEIGYIFKETQLTAKATLFYSKLHDIIAFGITGFDNTGDAIVKGVELEYEQAFGSHFQLDGNLTFTDSSDLETGQQVARAAKWMANLGCIVSPIENVALALRYRYVGERDRDAEDTRPPLDGYDLVDFTVNLHNLLENNLTLRAGIKNLFDDEVAYPAALRGVLNYEDDYPRPGRMWWVQGVFEW